MVLTRNTSALIIGIIIISGISLAAFSLLQSYVESSIKASIFDREKELQAKRAEQLSSRIGSDLQLLMTKLEVLANSGPAQSADFSSPEMDALLKGIFDESNSISRIEGTGISNAKNIVMNVYQPEIDKSRLIGQDMSSRPFAIEARSNFPNPTFSSGFQTMINSESQRIALLHPIINHHVEHIGWARSAVDASSFFLTYGNIRDVESEYFVVLDNKGTILVHPIMQLEGENYFGSKVKAQLGADEQTDLHYQKVLAGQEAVTDILGLEGPQERINTGYSIQTGSDKTAYFLFLITPTSSIYSEINEVLFTTRLQNSLLVTAIIAALVVLALSVIRWNQSLNREVEHKTTSLAESNEALSRAVKSLEEKDETQKQFINIAAHELRTPIQPLLGMADILEIQFSEKHGKDKIEVTKPELDMIVRNARRLERLSSDILDVARIESHSLPLNKETFDLEEVIIEAVRNTQNYLRTRDNIPTEVKKNIQVQFRTDELKIKDRKITIECDRGRITEVIDNLLANAIKFTDTDGIITITLKIQGSDNKSAEREDYAVVSIRDTGTGIDTEIMSRLFTKFVTKSDQGTGLGLFISRNIVEGHGGRIWAENNKDGKGATFTFTLPLVR